MELERAGTPSIMLEKDEKEEFLKRENELQDQLAEKESSLSKAEEALQAARNELKDLRETHATTSRDSDRLRGETEQLRMQVEKIEFETKEASITMDSLKEANGELTAELDDVKHQLLDAKMSAKESSALLDEKERLKKERMAQMMAGFDLGDGMASTSEMHVRETLSKVESLLELADNGTQIPAEDLHALRERLLETQGLVRQAELGSTANGHDIAADDDAEPGSLQHSLARQQEDNTRLRSELEALRKSALASPTNGMNKQLADFDTIKKSLMRDLQNRCERVVELEISLDSTREQYNSILRSSNSKQQQKKLAFLERNLEQLTLVQRQLVEQNAQLKKEVAIAERKLVARGERIRGLEGLVAESQEKLMVANHKYVDPAPVHMQANGMANGDDCRRFESQLLAVKERLEAAKQGSTRGLQGFNPSASSSGPNSNFNNNPFGRIAKPLRGGGGAPANDGASSSCLLYTSPSPRDGLLSRMPSSA